MKRLIIGVLCAVVALGGAFAQVVQPQQPQKSMQVSEIDGSFWVQLTSAQKTTIVLGYLIGMSSVEGVMISTRDEIQNRTDPNVKSIQFPGQSNPTPAAQEVQIVPEGQGSVEPVNVNSIKFSPDENKFFVSWAEYIISWSSYPETVAGIVASVDSFYSKYSNRDKKLFMVIPFLYDHEWW